MVVGRGDISPAAACNGAEETPEGDEAGELVAWFAREEIPKPDEGEPRTCQNLSALGRTHGLIIAREQGRKGGGGADLMLWR